MIGADYTDEKLMELGPYYCTPTKMHTSISERPPLSPGNHWCVDLKTGLPKTEFTGETMCLSVIDRGSGETIYFRMYCKSEVSTRLYELNDIVKAN